ncbi:hypothetical protein N9878_02525, partial [bacterium]|nr:hypothetical protein [bacterium]
LNVPLLETFLLSSDAQIMEELEIAFSKIPIFNYPNLTVNGRIEFFGSPLLNNFTVGGGLFTNVGLSSCPSLAVLNLGTGNVGDFTATITFRNSSLSSSILDLVIIELDRVALAVTAKDIDLRGNSARTTASDAAVASLITKNYNLLF